MNRYFDPYPFIDVVNKFYGAVCQGLDNNLLGNCVINLCIYSDPVQQLERNMNTLGARQDDLNKKVELTNELVLED